MRSSLREIGTGPYDLVVVGGGIVGAGVARDAVLRGLSVVLLDKGDLAGGTSSRSSKLIHGGARYLEHGDFHLVHEACTERRLLQRIAPHLVRPIPFVIPIYRSDRRNKWMIRAGMTLYDLMAMFRNTRNHQMLSPAQVIERDPALEKSGLTGGALYYDCQMDDARLVLENALDAAKHGAHVLNWAAVTGLMKTNGRISGVEVEDQLSHEKAEIGARKVLNLTGPWVDELRRLDDPSAEHAVRPTKGVHILVPRVTRDDAVVISAQSDDRVFFSLPWGEHTMIGTTDTDWTRSADEVATEEPDVDYLIRETARVFPHAKLERAAVMSEFSGLRPLMRQDAKSESAVTREHVFLESPSGLLSSVGGKYTTYRSMAAMLVDRVLGELDPPGKLPCSTDRRPLPGGATGPIAAFESEGVRELGARHGLDERTARFVLGRYGARAREVVALAAEDASLLAPVRAAGGAPFLRAEVVHAVRREAARTVADVMRRRTWLAFGAGQGADVADDVAALMARELGWSTEDRTREAETYRTLVTARRL